MVIIGVTGPTGAGKSTVLNEGTRMGGRRIDCDAVYARLLRESAELRAALEGRFGPVFAPNGDLDRNKLSSIVFADPDALSDLNELTHSHVKAEVQHLLEQAHREGASFVLVEAIALIESGLADWCDAVVGILASEELRLERIMAREGLTKEAALRRIKAQKPDAYFEQHCRHILRNEGEKDTLSRQARQLISALTEGKD